MRLISALRGILKITCYFTDFSINSSRIYDFGYIGILGKQLEAVVVDPASDWPLFAEKARELLTVEEVDVIFGCWTSVSRKSVLPVIEEVNGLLFYPVQYEGEESSKNVFYTGAFVPMLKGNRIIKTGK